MMHCETLSPPREDALFAGSPFKLPDPTEAEFQWICHFLHEQTGIVLRSGSAPMVKGRLERRLRHYGLGCYREYFARLGSPGQERETALAIDLLTTNETSFLREAAHFEFLRTQVVPHHPYDRPLRVWSAASSTGEEAYSAAMTLADARGNQNWEVVGTDVSHRVVEKATEGVYPLSAAAKFTKPWLKHYCLKGTDEFEGLFLMGPTLRARVHFLHANLLRPLPALGLFDVIFLRNVMIYFDEETRESLVSRLTHLLQPGGYFIVSHTESLQGLNHRLHSLGASIYQRPVDDVLTRASPSAAVI